MSIRDLRSAIKGPFTARFAAGACSVVSGPSGIGKSLLLRMIADLDPNTGLVELDSAARDAMPAPDWRRMVSYVPAESGWWTERVGDHMADTAAARDLFSAVGLDPSLCDAPVLRLSTGEKQRAALVRAIVARPRFLLLDEPTSALDLDSKIRVEAVLVEQKAAGRGLVVVSHDPDQVRRIADRLFVMSPAGLTETSA